MSSTLIIMFTVIFCLAATGLRAVEEKAATDKNAPDPKVMELMKPGPEHQQLAKLAGTWNLTCKFWMAPDAPPMETQGTMTIKAVFDGRFVAGEFTSTMHGQPFNGRSLNGYDRSAKEYVSIWYDSMGTGATRLSGQSSDGGRTITYAGEMTCPIQGHVQLKQVETHQSDDRFTLIGYQTKDGKEQKTMELVYTRKL